MAPWITSLTVSGSRTDTSHEDLRGIVEPLLETRTISEPCLIAFQLDARCADLLAQLVAQIVSLERLDIASCYWTLPRPSYGETEESFLLEGEQDGQAVPSYFASFIQSFSLNKSLKFLSLYLEDFPPDAIQALLTSLSKAKSLQKVAVRGIGEEEVREFGLSVFHAGLSGRLSSQHQYRICPAVLAALELSPCLNNIIIDSRAVSGDLFKAAISRIPAWRYVTTLWLMMTEGALDNVTVEDITMYLSQTTILKELCMFGCNNVDLRRSSSAKNRPHSSLL